MVENNLLNCCISAVAIVISIFSLNSNYNVLNPKFSLSLFHIDGTEYTDFNRILKIYNCGGQIVNSKIEPQMFLDIYYSNADSTYQGDILIEIRNYFSENYFFDYNESAFVIQETMANEVYSFVDNINNTLAELDLFHIDLFSIKTYYSITYSNYSGKRRKKFLNLQTIIIMKYMSQIVIGNIFLIMNCTKLMKFQRHI